MIAVILSVVCHGGLNQGQACGTNGREVEDGDFGYVLLHYTAFLFRNIFCRSCALIKSTAQPDTESFLYPRHDTTFDIVATCDFDFNICY